MRTHSKSSLFLIELIIAILFFSLSSVVCVNMFLSAHVLAEESAQRSGAVTAAQTAAEIYREGGIQLLSEMTSAELTNDVYFAGFDDTGAFSQNGEYRAEFTETSQEDLYTLDIELFDDDTLIYDLSVTLYQPYKEY